jgi:hypothetical protein
MSPDADRHGTSRHLDLGSTVLVYWARLELKRDDGS